MNVIETALIKKGVEALKDYGYPEVSEDNIISDEIYSSFFKEMLRGSIGQSRDIDNAIIGICLIINETHPKK